MTCPNCSGEMQRLLPNVEYHLLGGEPYKSVIVYDVSYVWCPKDGTLIDRSPKPPRTAVEDRN